MIKSKTSFSYALLGLSTAFRTQLNFRIHIIAMIIVSVLTWYFRITGPELLTLIFTVTLVIFAEMINTSLEYLGNAVTLKYNQEIKNAKDVSSGAVLITAIMSVIVGLIIFIPKVFN